MKRSFQPLILVLKIHSPLIVWGEDKSTQFLDYHNFLMNVLGASTGEAQQKVAEVIAEQMIEVFAERSYPGVVNVPFLSLSSSPIMKPYIQVFLPFLF